MAMIYGPECDCGHVGPTITGYGSDDAQVVAVGIAPGRQEIKEGRPFMGPAGKRFNDVLKVCGFDRSQIYCTNLICWFKDKPEESEIAACWPRLRAELEARRPKLILALGALASEWLTGYKVGKVRGGVIDGSDLAPTAKLWDYGHKQVYVLDRKAIREGGISEPRRFFADQNTIVACQVADRLRGGSGNWLSAVQMVVKHVGEPVVKVHPDLHVMSTWHPAATLGGRNPALVGDLVRDFKKIPRFLAGELSPIPFRQHEITSRREAQQALHWFSGRVAALDVETTFDTPTSWGSLLCLSISTYVKPSEFVRSLNPDPRSDGYYVSYYFPREVLDDLDWPGSIRDGVRREGTLWGFHSGPFDRNVLRRELGVDLPIIWDSMYDSYSCDERPGYDRDDRAGGVGGAGSGRNKAIGPGYHNLDQLAREYCGAGFFKDATKDWIGVDPSNWVSPGSEDQAATMRGRWAALRERNALDAAYTMALPSRLPRGQSAPCYSTLLLPAANAYADVSRTGIRIDVDRLRALESDWSAERNSMEKHLEEWAADLGYTNPPKRKRDLSGEPFNPASTTQLAKLLFGVKAPPDGEAGFAGLGVRSRVKTKKGKPSTSEEALQEIDHPFVLELMRLRKYANTLKYLPMIRTHLRPDGRVHPTFLPLVTGRYSALDPAMQTFPQPYKLAADGVPELAVLRSIIIPSEGFVLCETDYEQIEIWVAALLSGDPVMLADLTAPFEGGKPNYHSNVTRNVLKCDEEVGSDVWEKTRRGAKVFTFGIEFGEGPEGLAKHASKEMGLGTKMSKGTAARIIRDWYDRYAVFAEWQRNQVRLARKQGYLENPFGFVRRFPFPDDVFKNQMYNAAIQGTASQHGTIALVELVDPMYFGLPYPGSDDEGEFTIYRRPHHLPFELSGCEPLHRAVGGNVLLSIHDSIVSEIPEDKVESGIAHIEQVMSHPRVPGWPGMLVASSTGKNWHEMKKR